MSQYLKRLGAPKSWPLSQRKGLKYIAKPMPGPHKLEESITLNVILQEILGYAKTRREVKRVLNQGKILINSIVRKDHKFPVGLMDILVIPELDKQFILLYDKTGKFMLHPINKEESENKLVRIIKKTLLKKGKLQLNFHDGTNLLVEKDNYKLGDSVILNKNKIKKHLKLEKGALVYLTSGKHKGRAGTLESIGKSNGFSKSKISVKSDKGTITTMKDYVFVVEKAFVK